MGTANQFTCPKCAAFAGQPCLSRQSRPLMRFHKERIAAATRTNVQKLKPEQDEDLQVRISKRKAAS